MGVPGNLTSQALPAGALSQPKEIVIPQLASIANTIPTTVSNLARCTEACVDPRNGLARRSASGQVGTGLSRAWLTGRAWRPIDRLEYTPRRLVSSDTPA